MSDDIEELRRLHLATRLHGAAMPVIEMLLTPDGAVSIRDLHIICSVAERIERAGDRFGPEAGLFIDLLSALMKQTEIIRTYVDDKILSGAFDPAQIKGARLGGDE